jgi:hypothetical protein
MTSSLFQALGSLRTAMVDEFCAAVEFKAFTELAYVFATQYTIPQVQSAPVTIGYSQFAGATGLADRTFPAADIQGHIRTAKERYFFSLIHQHQVALFEHNFFRLIRLLIEHEPRHLSGKRQLEYALVLNAKTREEIIALLIDREINETKYKNVGEWFSYLEKLASGISLPQGDIERIAEAKASRDILVHNAGIVNQTYVNKAGPAARFVLGELLDVSGHYTRDTWTLFLNSLTQVVDSLLARFSPKSADA